jgi:hypothetical protein
VVEEPAAGNLTRVDSPKLDLPKLGEALFTSADDWQNNACVSRGWVSDAWDLYAEGFKRAADGLVDGVIENRIHPLDCVVYPIVTSIATTLSFG